jgi:hypothetical protein
MRRKLILISLILFPLNAFAAGPIAWKNMATDQNLPTFVPRNTTNNLFDLDSAQYITPGTTAYMISTGDGSGTQLDYSKVLLTTGCKSFTLLFHPNKDSITTNTAARGEAYYCAGGTPTADGTGGAASCYKITGDINNSLVGIDNYTLTGDPGNASSDYDSQGNDNRGWIQNIEFGRIQVKFTTDPTNTFTGAFIGECK